MYTTEEEYEPKVVAAITGLKQGDFRDYCRLVKGCIIQGRSAATLFERCKLALTAHQYYPFSWLQQRPFVEMSDDDYNHQMALYAFFSYIHDKA
jgi:hypothetical protein